MRNAGMSARRYQKQELEVIIAGLLMALLMIAVILRGIYNQ
jgi:hypothetical protein